MKKNKKEEWWEKDWDRIYGKDLQKPVAWLGIISDKTVLSTQNNEAKYFIKSIVARESSKHGKLIRRQALLLGIMQRLNKAEADASKSLSVIKEMSRLLKNIKMTEYEK